MSTRTAPGTWFFHELQGNDGLGYIRTTEDSHEISHHGDSKRSKDENLANAAFIVLADHHFDALEAALREIIAANSAISWKGCECGVCVAVNKAHAVLAALTKERGES